MGAMYRMYETFEDLDPINASREAKLIIVGSLHSLSNPVIIMDDEVLVYF